MLEGGRVVEEGSHDVLVARGGRYAALFRLQAERFAQDAEPDESEDQGDLEAEADIAAEGGR
jgi:ATP-binding cassette subfamily B protein